MIRIFNHYVSKRILLLMLLEGSLLYTAIFAGVAVRFYGSTGVSISPGIGASALPFAFFMIVVMSALGMYQSNQLETFRSTVYRTAIAFVISMPILAVVFYVAPQTYIGRGVFAITTALSFSAILLIRLFFFHWTSFGILKRRVLVLGAGADAQLILDLCERDASHSIEVVGVHPLGSTDIQVKSRNIIPAELSVADAVKRHEAHEVIITVREQRGGAIPWNQLLDCKLRGVSVTDVSSFFERELGQIRLDSLKPSWLIFRDGCHQGVVREMVKVVFDFVVSASLLLLTLPITLIVALLIVLEDGAPLFYRQERVGKGGQTFEVLKFRSMRKDAERDGKPQWASSNDDRTTRVGRFIRRTRIDELPQIINVLRGEMSFFGPRPERPFFVRQLAQEIPFYAARHSVKPGITGWAQVRYPYGASVEDAVQKHQYDLYYIKNHSLFMDLLILIETVQVVLWGKGAR